MHKVDSRTYIGQPSEAVAVNTTLAGGGQHTISVDGQPIVGGRFQLPGTPGGAVRMTIALAGPQGASCLVALSTVDGGSDTDFLLCTVFNPAPVNLYDFSVARADAVTSLAAARGVRRAATRPRRVAKKKVKPQSARRSRGK